MRQANRAFIRLHAVCFSVSLTFVGLDLVDRFPDGRQGRPFVPEAQGGDVSAGALFYEFCVLGILSAISSCVESGFSAVGASEAFFGPSTCAPEVEGNQKACI